MTFLAKRGLGLNLASVRRGFEVYWQVCSKCHSLELFKLEDLKSLKYSKSYILHLSKGRRVSKPIGVPYLSKSQARAFNNGVIPPDLSLITKRKSVSFVKDVLFGYTTQTAAPPMGYYYNNSFESGIISMPPALVNGLVSYTSRARRYLTQYVLDIAEFLTWVSEPWFNLRGKLSLPVIGVFSLVFSLNLIILNKEIKARSA